MTNPQWGKRATDEPIYEGVRAADVEEFEAIEDWVKFQIQIIFDAMDWPQLIVFNYDGSDRVVAPFVVGVSRDGNPLLRGYQLEGVSRSGKGPGWRVFQVRKMNDLDNFQDYFYKEDFDFDQFYPWTYKVIKML